MDMEKQVNYKPRIADRLLARKLEGMGAVLIEGPKWCGKTTTAEQQARSILYMDDPREKMQNIQAADINPEMLLAGDTPRLIDEWQIAPQLWDAIRFSVDHRNMDGQFISRPTHCRRTCGCQPHRHRPHRESTDAPNELVGIRRFQWQCEFGRAIPKSCFHHGYWPS